MPYDIDNDIEVDNESSDQFAGFAKETTLELVEADDGRLLLRDAEGDVKDNSGHQLRLFDFPAHPSHVGM